MTHVERSSFKTQTPDRHSGRKPNPERRETGIARPTASLLWQVPNYHVRSTYKEEPNPERSRTRFARPPAPLLWQVPNYQVRSAYEGEPNPERRGTGFAGPPALPPWGGDDEVGAGGEASWKLDLRFARKRPFAV